MRKTALPCTRTVGAPTALPCAPSAPIPAARAADSVPSTSSPTASILTAELPRHVEDWLLDCDYRQHSSRTIETRRVVTDKLLWFLLHHGHASCGLSELRQFLAYLRRGHENPEGRWDNKQNPRCSTTLRPATVHMYYSHLRTFFRWTVAEGVVESSPMDRLTPPVARPDQIQPFTQDQVEAILQAAKRGNHPRRDKAIVLFLLDTGVRASELCSLKMCDVDLPGRSCRVLGKGNKYRSLSFSRETGKVLSQYLQREERQADDALFRAGRGTEAGGALTRSGLFQLVQRLGKEAGIQATRCSPHTFRHTCAVEFLRAGGGVFVLKAMLGHTSLAVTNRYCAVAQADIQSQHQKFSPVERLRRRGSSTG